MTWLSMAWAKAKGWSGWALIAFAAAVVVLFILYRGARRDAKIAEARARMLVQQRARAEAVLAAETERLAALEESSRAYEDRMAAAQREYQARMLKIIKARKELRAKIAAEGLAKHWEGRLDQDGRPLRVDP